MYRNQEGRRVVRYLPLRLLYAGQDQALAASDGAERLHTQYQLSARAGLHLRLSASTLDFCRKMMTLPGRRLTAVRRPKVAVQRIRGRKATLAKLRARNIRRECPTGASN